MTAYYGSAPVFADGQIMSASQHLNRLLRLSQLLRDDVLGAVNVPFTGNFWTEDSGRGAGVFIWTRGWWGYMRHRYDNLMFIYEGDSEIKINGTPVSGTRYTGPGAHQATVDISSFNLQYDELYRIEVGLDENPVNVWLLRETINDAVPQPPNFVDNTTPSASNWQTLSDTADYVNARQTSPTAMFGGAPTLWNGSFYRKCRYLYYKIQVVSPHNDDPDSGERWAEADILVGNTAVGATPYLKLRAGKIVDPNSPPPNGFTGFEVGRGGSHTFTGTIDLDDFPGGIAISEIYRVRVDHTYSWWWDPGRINIIELFEIPDYPLVVAGWQAMDDWEYGEYVKGNSTAVQVQKLRDNLVLLRNSARFLNYPCVQYAVINPFATDDPPFTRPYAQRRRRRWLKYKNNRDVQVKLTYKFGNETKDQSLPDASDNELAYDLDGVEGLFPGVSYTLTGANYAHEDDEV